MMKWFVLLFVLLGFLESCNQEDGLSYNHMIVSLATVEQVSGNAFLLRLDNDTVLDPLVDDASSFAPFDSQRVMINYTILSKNAAPDNSYNYKIRLNDVTNVVTKAITLFSAATNDSIGNDPINVTDCWIGSHYVNVTFTYDGSSANHLISLVKLTSGGITSDSTVYLELRHNAYRDFSMNLNQGVVSFDIRSLQKSNGAPVKIMVTAKGTNGVEKVYSLIYKYMV
jgi:hypothetical protein